MKISLLRRAMVVDLRDSCKRMDEACSMPLCPIQLSKNIEEFEAIQAEIRDFQASVAMLSAGAEIFACVAAPLNRCSSVYRIQRR